MSREHVSVPWEVHGVEDGTLVRVLLHDLDSRTALLLVDELYELVQASGRPNLFLDFGEVEYLSSTVLTQLIVLDRTLHDGGGQLSLFSVNPYVRELLCTTHLIDLLDVRAIPLPRAFSPGP